MKSKAGFETVKIDKPLARLTRDKSEVTQITNIKNKRSEITTHCEDSKRIYNIAILYIIIYTIIQKYYGQIYAIKFNNLDKVDK